MAEHAISSTSRRSDSIPGPKWDTGRSHACDVSCHDECGGSYRCMDQDGWSGYDCQCTCHNVHGAKCTFPGCNWSTSGHRWADDAERRYREHVVKHKPEMTRR